MNNNLLPIAFLVSSCLMMSCQLNAENLKTKVNDAPIEMIEVRGGSFMMGDHNKQNKDALPLHKVSLDSYYVGRTEVTQQLWEAVMGYNNSTYKGEYRPVESIDYEEIMSFLKKLNAMTGIKFRLLTEAEWEFAARGGLFSKGYVYSGSDNLEEVGWTGNTNPTKVTHNVANKAPNELGIYDMTGNVWEWCSDYNGAYTSEEQKNPTGPAKETWHEARGGSYRHYAYWCQVCYRDLRYPASKDDGLGFRLAMDATKSNIKRFEVATEWYLTQEVVAEKSTQSAEIQEKDIVQNPTEEQLVGLWQRFSNEGERGRQYGPFFKLLSDDHTFKNFGLASAKSLKFQFGGTGTWKVKDNCLMETVDVGSNNAFHGKTNAMELILSDKGDVMHLIYINTVTGARMDEYYVRVK
jgi:formylglycine-generating enzyme required for sulfatase activity